ncbi:hypothetical protein [Marinifilum flexuosum]|uniref:DUF2500 family protein n=1 Tax=Marinifilum flexuosum TaxID=1117708 RepID=A0A419WFB2_9BACT|nr:hypothetical protein [Marinifilum flexuosum]RKD94075.1 hypothetical protein BXY64_4238 [Marinifilum flexuosum]
MRIKETIFGILLFVTMIIGFFTIYIIVSQTIVNYEKPYLFGAIFIVLGILFGIKLSKRINRDKAIKYDYTLPFYLSIIFVGLLMFSSTICNERLSETSDYKVIVENKDYSQGYRGSSGTYTLYFYIGDERKRLVCSEELGETINRGNEIEIRFHKSKVGFDFITYIEN